MRRFKHKPTGLVATENVNHGHYSFSDTVLPLCIVTGTDWEEIIEKDYWYDQVIPPGIEQFYGWNHNRTSVGYYNCTIDRDPTPEEYRSWVLDHFKQGHTICRIKADNLEWLVGEDVMADGVRFKIKSFLYTGAPKPTSWDVIMEGTPTHKFNIWYLSKITERKQVVTLQGKDLFNGDSYWFVDKKFNRSHVVLGEQPYYNNPFLVYFSTIELAEQYIIDNKPVYPAGPVDQVVRLYNLYKEFPNVDKAVEDAIQQLKKFKQ